jgi:predicted acetyltransferase
MQENFQPNVESERRPMTAILERPSSQYKESYLAALAEFQTEGNYTYLDIEELENDFQGFIDKIPEIRNVINRVPETEYWLTNKGKFIGRLSIRHELNEELLLHGGHIGYAIRPSERKKGYATQALEQGLVEAQKLGLRKVLLTCDSTNIASRKVIESNGGVLENEVEGKPGEPSKLRFWISLEG